MEEYTDSEADELPELVRSREDEDALQWVPGRRILDSGAGETVLGTTALSTDPRAWTPVRLVSTA